MSLFDKDEKLLLDKLAGSRKGSDLLEEKISIIEEDEMIINREFVADESYWELKPIFSIPLQPNSVTKMVIDLLGVQIAQSGANPEGTPGRDGRMLTIHCLATTDATSILDIVENGFADQEFGPTMENSDYTCSFGHSGLNFVIQARNSEQNVGGDAGRTFKWIARVKVMTVKL